MTLMRWGVLVLTALVLTIISATVDNAVHYVTINKKLRMYGVCSEALCLQ